MEAQGEQTVTSILDSIGQTPLVQLHTFESPRPIYVKCEHLNPGGSVKDRLALALIEDGERQGKLCHGDTVVEATAGNTGLGLALVCAARGYRLVCVMPEKMSKDKRRALKACGAEVRIAPNAPLDSPENFRNKAEALAAEKGWFLADQFRNMANVRAHFENTGPELFAQLQGQVGAFVAGIGTGGTITGVGSYLKSQNPKTKIILADPVGSSLASLVNTGVYGEDGSYLVEGIGSSKASEILDLSVIDSAISITDTESFTTARLLQAREGLFAGGSSGTAVAAALKAAEDPEIDGPIVALLADSWDRYFCTDWMNEEA